MKRLEILISKNTEDYKKSMQSTNVKDKEIYGKRGLETIMYGQNPRHMKRLTTEQRE